MKLTYRKLAELIADLPENRKDDDATVYDAILDEFVPISSFQIADEEGVASGILDEGHAFLAIDEV